MLWVLAAYLMQTLLRPMGNPNSQVRRKSVLGSGLGFDQECGTASE
jgi:hypothetical protein